MVSQQQIARIISILALLLAGYGITTEQLNTVVIVLSVLVSAVMDVYGYIRRFKQGDVNVVPTLK